MAYTKNPTWQDYDGTDDTLITAAKLNHLEDGVEAAAAAADGASQPGHTHDDRYYTETETDSLLSDRAAASHTHDDSVPLDAQAGLDHDALVQDFMRARGGSIGTGGVAAVALRFDHGMVNFKNIVLPLLKARGLPCGLAINTSADDLAAAENAGVTWAEIYEWNTELGVEVWNHSHTHEDSVGDAAIYANLVTDPMAVFAENLPNTTIEGFAIPGGTADFNGWTDTNTPAHFSSQYSAGRAVLRNHAAVTGHLGGTIWGMTGHLVNGRRHLGMDTITSAATITDILAQAQALQGGVQLFLHPSVINLTGGITTAILTEILDWIVVERDAGRLVVLTMSGLMCADVRHSYRHNVARDIGYAPAWSGAQLANYTWTGSVVSSNSATATIRQQVDFTHVEAIKGRQREFIVEARAAGGTPTLRLWHQVSPVTGAPMSVLKSFVIPDDNTWRTYRIFGVMLSTGFNVKLDVGRVAGTGTLEMRNLRLQAV